LRIRFAKQAAKDLDAAVVFWKERRPAVRFTLVDDVIMLAERLAREEFDGPVASSAVSALLPAA
jgi:hypothetical protein